MIKHDPPSTTHVLLKGGHQALQASREIVLVHTVLRLGALLAPEPTTTCLVLVPLLVPTFVLGIVLSRHRCQTGPPAPDV